MKYHFQIEFAEFYRHSSSQLQQYIIMKERKNRPEAEDIVQDIFLQLWERRSQLNAIKSLENYVFIMIRNRLFNERKREFIKRNALKYIRENHADPANLTDQCVLYRELNRAFERCIDELSPKNKQAFELQNAGVKTETIAGCMSISTPVVKNHLRKAKNQEADCPAVYGLISRTRANREIYFSS